MSHSSVPAPITAGDVLSAIGTPLQCTGVTLEIHSEISSAVYARMFFAYHGDLDPYREGIAHYVMSITDSVELTDVLAVLDDAQAKWSIELVLVRATP